MENIFQLQRNVPKHLIFLFQEQKTVFVCIFLDQNLMSSYLNGSNFISFQQRASNDFVFFYFPVFFVAE